MEKPAPANHPVHDLILRRWSPRAFDDREVTDGELLSLFEAARWAPSCFNEQPWSFLVATKKDAREYERLLSCLVEFNQSWAKTAPVLMISIAHLQFQRNAKPNRHGVHDVGLAVENMVLQATSMGLFVHQMAGFDADKVRELYGVPETHEPVAAIALGRPGDAAKLESEKARQGETEPRERKPLDAFVFTGSWGKTSPLAEA